MDRTVCSSAKDEEASNHDDHIDARLDGSPEAREAGASLVHIEERERFHNEAKILVEQGGHE